VPDPCPPSEAPIAAVMWLFLGDLWTRSGDARPRTLAALTPTFGGERWSFPLRHPHMWGRALAGLVLLQELLIRT
jgi:hypothetical protein